MKQKSQVSYDKLWKLGAHSPTTLNSFPNSKSYDSSKLKEFADDNFKFDENGGKFSKSVGKHCGKRRNCSL